MTPEAAAKVDVDRLERTNGMHEGECVCHDSIPALIAALHAAEQRADAAEQESERLREAVVAMLKDCAHDPEHPYDHSGPSVRTLEAARAALAPSAPTNEGGKR